MHWNENSTFRRELKMLSRRGKSTKGPKDSRKKNRGGSTRSIYPRKCGCLDDLGTNERQRIGLLSKP